jgi:hypothetical protein
MFNKTVTMGWESKEIRRKCKPGSKKEMDPACFSASSNPTRPRKLREIQERFRSLSNLYCIYMFSWMQPRKFLPRFGGSLLAPPTVPRFTSTCLGELHPRLVPTAAACM